MPWRARLPASIAPVPARASLALGNKTEAVSFLERPSKHNTVATRDGLNENTTTRGRASVSEEGRFHLCFPGVGGTSNEGRKSLRAAQQFAEAFVDCCAKRRVRVTGASVKCQEARCDLRRRFCRLCTEKRFDGASQPTLFDTGHGCRHNSVAGWNGDFHTPIGRQCSNAREKGASIKVQRTTSHSSFRTDCWDAHLVAVIRQAG